MIGVKLVDGVRSHFVYRLPEWMLASFVGSFGIQLLWNGKTFESSPTYRVMGFLASETTWGRMALCLSLFWLGALIFNGSFAWFRRWSPWVRSLSAFASAGFWSVIAIGLFEANPISTGVTNSAGLAVFCYVVSLITALEVGAKDKQARNADP